MSRTVPPTVARTGLVFCFGFLLSCSPKAEIEVASNLLSEDIGLPNVRVVHVFEPSGESNVRSSFRLADGVGLVGTEESGDIYRTEDAGMSWQKIFDGGEAWGIQDVRNFIRGADGHLYITTTEPAVVAGAADEGVTWTVLAKPESSRTVGLVQLDSGVILAGLRRSENGRTSIIRSTDGFDSSDWIVVSPSEPRQNVTCFGYWGGSTVFAGIGYEGPGKIYKSTDEGLTWTKKAEFPDARDLMDFFRTDDRLFVLASGIATLFASDDGGESWSMAHQFWPKGFLGQCVPFEWEGRSYWLMCATDQSEEFYRHVVLISDDAAQTWTEWIELARDSSGGASNITVLSEDTIVVGTGNHSAQGRVFTLKTSPKS